MFAHKKPPFGPIYPVKCAIFVFYLQFYKARFLGKNSKKHDFECNFFSEKHDFECKFFWEKHDFESNFFRFVRFWINFFSSCQMSKQKFLVLSVFESTFLKRVSFGINHFTTRQILKRNNLLKYTTCTFHIAFLQITKYSYRLQFLRQPDNNHHRSKNTSCTLFRKDLHFWFRYGATRSSPILLDICENKLLLKVKLQQLKQF